MGLKKILSLRGGSDALALSETQCCVGSSILTVAKALKVPMPYDKKALQYAYLSEFKASKSLDEYAFYNNFLKIEKVDVLTIESKATIHLLLDYKAANAKQSHMVYIYQSNSRNSVIVHDSGKSTESHSVEAYITGLLMRQEATAFVLYAVST